ncbi:MAG TPA: hypothetical protein VFR55_04280 [Dehalococcoidia bacterium]|nr:hypothetical protein [Dehalococcoidia bacterium]
MAFGDPLATAIAAGVGYLVDVAELQEIRDALRFLKGLDGETELDDVLKTLKHFRGSVQVLGLSAQVDDGDPQDASLLRLSPTGDQSISGLIEGTQGRLIFLVNISTTDTVTILHNNAGSAAGNRFWNPGQVNFDLTPDMGVVVAYETTAARWRVLGIAGSFVPTDGAHTINDVKTFSSIPVLPASDPTTDNQAARKVYVDSLAPKAWATVASDGTLQANSHNISGVVKDDTGDYTVSFDTDFANTNYACLVTIESALQNSDRTAMVHTPAVGSIKVAINVGGLATDMPFHLAAFGDQ